MSNQPGQLFGHPLGLWSLFLTEMWERLSYYGMRALLVLFLVEAVGNGGFGLDDRTATAVYGLYTAGAYLSGLPGGWVADRLLGAQRAVLLGGIVIALGHVMLAIGGDPRIFYLGLVVIVLGTGLLKPNASSLVGTLYPEGGARADAGYTLFYMGVNVGAFMGPLITGGLRAWIGWHAAFLAAAVGMVIGVLQFAWTRRWLGDAGRTAFTHDGVPVTRGRPRDYAFAAGGLAVLLAIVALGFSGAVPLSAVAMQGFSINVIVGLIALYFVYLLLFAGLDVAEKKRVVVLVILVAASCAFWSGFEQAGSSLNLFAQRYTDRMIGGFEIPAEWFQALNSTFIILCAPLFSALWILLARHGRQLSFAVKFAVGLTGMALGFLIMAAAARIVAGGELAAPTWLVLTYLFHTLGELALSPIGMSATARLTPQRFAGQSMGVWFASLSLGNLVASRIAGDFDASRVDAMPGQYMFIFWFGVVAAAILLAFSPLMRRWSGGIK